MIWYTDPTFTYIVWRHLIVGDITLKLPFVLWLQIHSAMSNKASYMYEFDHRRPTPPSWYEGPAWLRTGADHADELLYVFGIPLLAGTRLNSQLIDVNINLHSYSKVNSLHALPVLCHTRFSLQVWSIEPLCEKHIIFINLSPNMCITFMGVSCSVWKGSALMCRPRTMI